VRVRGRYTYRRLGNASRSIPILAYHSIDDSASVLSTSIQTFRRHLETLREMGLTTVQVSDIAAWVRGRRALPQRAIALTFDDGFASVYKQAFPLLCRYGFTATVYLVTDYCGRLNVWPGQPREIPRLPLLEWGQIQEMNRHGIQFGAHTKTHPDLRRLSTFDLEREVQDSKRVIEDRLGQAVDSFAYPYGHCDDRILAVVRERFAAACSTELAFVQGGSNPWCLERVDTYYLRPRLFPRHLYSPLAGAYLRVRRTLRAMRHSRAVSKPMECKPASSSC
jgi:peptidoglycan/xylan/chitin deacetylase (PgdA/CDA1 family)